MIIKKSLFAVALVATLISCGGSGMPKFGDNEYAVAVVSNTSSSLQTTYPATIKGIQDVEVRPKVSGFITKVYVHEGQSVSAGQLLFSIDSETYQANVRQAAAAVRTAKSQMNTARLTYENYKKLLDKHIIGEYELQTAKNTYLTARASVAQAEASLASAKEMLSYCYVKSPAPGVIGSLPFKVGALVSAQSPQPLTVVSDITTMEVFFSMSESEMLDMTKAAGSMKAALASFPPVKLKLADGTIYSYPGKVVKMSGVIDATTGSVSLIAHFPNPDRLLKSGGAGTIIIDRNNNYSIQVPQEAVAEIQNKKFVYVVGQDNKVKYTEITVDPQNNGETYIVTSGLKVGDRYVCKGIPSLTDGMLIKPISLGQYEKKIKDAAKLGEKQESASSVIDALKGK